MIYVFTVAQVASADKYPDRETAKKEINVAIDKGQAQAKDLVVIEGEELKLVSIHSFGLGSSNGK